MDSISTSNIESDSDISTNINTESPIYIFKNGLFTRSLLNIDINKEREILVKYISCVYKKVDILNKFQSSNFVKYYRNKHPNIAYNKEFEKSLKLKTDIPDKNTLFKQFESRNRNRTNILIDFNESEAYNKILNFIIQNNLSFNILNSNSFKDLLNYYNRLNPIINRKKFKIILEKTYFEYLSIFNQQIQQNIDNNGSFSITFDIWTANTQTSYLGIILIYIDNNFHLNYRLIGFEELSESHTGLYIYNKFVNILNIYSNFNLNNILSITRDNASNNNITSIPLDNITRWNSIYYMIKIAFELKEVIIYIGNNTTNKEFKRNILNESDWLALSELQNIFEIFVKPSTKLQGQLYIILNMNLLYIYQIYNKLENLIIIYKDKLQTNIISYNYYNNFISAIQIGIEKLEKYFLRKLTNQNFKSYKPYILSIILNPRFKLIHFKEDGLLYFYPNISKDIFGLLKFEYLKLKSELKGKSTSNLNISFDELNAETYNNSSSDSDSELYIQPDKIEEEYIIYLNESNITKKIDSLTYWKQNSYKFPILSILARRYLAIPTTL